MRVQVIEDLRLQNIAPDDGEPGRRLGRVRLLDHPAGAGKAAVVVLDVENAVSRGQLNSHFLDGDDVAAGVLVGLHHLGQASRPGLHQIVGQQHGKGTVENEFLGAPDRMAQP